MLLRAMVVELKVREAVWQHGFEACADLLVRSGASANALARVSTAGATAQWLMGARWWMREGSKRFHRREVAK